MERDWLVEQLPRVMQEDPFIRGLTGIAQEIATSIRDEVEKIDYFLDAHIAPEEFVRWVGGWLGITVEPVIPDALERERRVRRVVETAGQLFLQRGTRAGLEGMLRAITGEPASVSDSGGVFRTGQAPANQKHVTIRLRANGGIRDQQILRLIQQEIPVDVTFDLRIDGRLVTEETPAELGRLHDIAAEARADEVEEQVVTVGAASAAALAESSEEE